MLWLVGFVSLEPHKHDAEERIQLVQTRLKYCDVGVWRPIKKFKAAGYINFSTTYEHLGFTENIQFQGISRHTLQFKSLGLIVFC